jgi:hypothetical protein
MGRKSSSKANRGDAPATAAPPRSKTPIVVAGALIAAFAIGGLTYFGSSPAVEQDAAAAAAAQFPDRGPIPADLKAHPQENLPPLEFPAYPTARPADVVRAAYRFAAEHPEVLSYVPCFCGCERAGHRGNEDCFVKARDVNGDVVQWEEHGMECTVCLDVATRSQQLYNSGASVADIRASIEREFGARAITHTPTPEVPHNH